MRTVNPGLGTYIEQIPIRPRLSREEELRLIHLAQAARRFACSSRAASGQPAWMKSGMEAAREAKTVLVESFLYKVVGVAKLLLIKSGPRLTLAELVSAGNECLVRAVEKYDPSRGTRFWTCAQWWVHDAMNRELRFSRWLMAISDEEYRKALKIAYAQGRLWADYRHPPTEAELARFLRWDPHDLRDTLYRLTLNDVLSIDRPVGEGEYATLADLLADERGMYPLLSDGADTDSVASAANDMLVHDELQAQLGAIRSVEKDVLEWRFGLKDGRARTLEEVGKQLGFSAERARQIQKRALCRLREEPYASRLRRLMS